MKTKIYLTLFIFLSAAGCQKQMENFVDRTRPPASETVPTPTPTPLPTATNNSIRLSPGHVRAAGSSVGAEISVGTTQTALKGSSLGMRVGITKGGTSQ